MVKKVFFSFVIMLYFLLFFFLFLFYSPFELFRSYLITTAMTTKSHQYFATFFYEEEDILKVISNHRVIEANEITRLQDIVIHSKKNPLYKLKTINGKGYSGYLVEIYDPTRIQLVTSSKIGEEGENALEIAEREKAKAVINSVGFYDPNWVSNGAIAHGTVIQNGKVISDYGEANVGGGYIGFTKKGKLFLGNVSTEKLLSLGVSDAIQFGPYLIINGKESVVNGNGGFGLAPRTAIGQKKDGTVLFLVINGRIPSSIGASMKDLIQIMKQNGAYNAANLDGGSSSVLVLDSKVINRPVGGGKNGLRKLPVFWVLK